MTTDSSKSLLYDLSNLSRIGLVVIFIIELIFIGLSLYKFDLALIYLGAILSIVFGLQVLKNLVYGIYGLLFSIFLGPIAVISMGSKAPQFYFLDLVIILVGLVFLIQTIQSFRITQKIIIPKIALLFGIFLFYCAVFLFQSTNMTRGIASLRPFIAGIMTLLLVYKTVNQKKIVVSFVNVLTFWGVILSILIFSTFFHDGYLHGSEFQKGANLSWGRSNYLATFLVLLIPITMSLISCKSLPKKQRFIFVIATLTMIGGMMMTGSRAGVLAFLVSMIVLIFRILRKKYVIQSITLIIFIVFVIIKSPAFSFIIEGISNFMLEPSVIARTIAWYRSWDVFTHNPIVGIGIGNIGYFIGDDSLGLAKPHNFILKLLGETGIIGFVLFSSIIVRLVLVQIKNIKRIKNESHNLLSWGILAGTVGVLSHAMVEPSFWGYAMMVVFWCVVGLSLASFFKILEF
ncbi:MAG: O-antigen ligase family protein [Bacteroidetes bacterium]|nr:O-antigen ligase family protein [Bacteroidota bacterium]